MAILLIRHGETPGNAARVLQTEDTPLSARGREQARRLAERLSALGVAHILSSDLVRARMTAECVREATGAPLELEALLQERSFGDVRGTPYAELGFDPFAPDYAPPGGETWERFHARVARGFERVRELAERTPGHLAVVTHGLFCLSLVTRQLPAPPPAERLARGFANAGLTRIELGPPPRVALLDCTAHLEPGAPGPRDGPA